MSEPAVVTSSSTFTIARPEPGEYAPYYERYVSLVSGTDILGTLEAERRKTLLLLSGRDEADGDFRYAPDKWSIRQVLNHLSDCERLFTFRAFWFARGFDSPLPSFDQHIAVAGAQADSLSWDEHVQEFHRVRLATLSFFRNLPEDAWARRGIASDNPFTVRALAYVAAGHVVHHVKILRERYLEGNSNY